MWTWGRFSVTWGFGAMLLVAGLAGAGSVMPLVALSAVCHELGHLAGLRLAGAAVESFRLTAFGAEIRADTRYLPYGREILCTLAGPAVNLLLALVLARTAGDYILAGAHSVPGRRAAAVPAGELVYGPGAGRPGVPAGGGGLLRDVDCRRPGADAVARRRTLSSAGRRRDASAADDAAGALRLLKKCTARN